jgi:hypothetical protein
MMLPEQQLERLKREFPEASFESRPDGSLIVVVPDVPLPPGWNKQLATVVFHAPVGYPAAQPDSFWADPDLRLASGAQPKNTGFQPTPSGGEPKLWFSWHIETWNPNRDSLLSYLKAIQNRLQCPE